MNDRRTIAYFSMEIGLETAAAAGQEFARQARKYIALLTQHIDKENNVLFPMGEKVIPEKKQEDLVAAFEDLEREKIGVGTHEAFHKLLHQLQEVYE